MDLLKFAGGPETNSTVGVRSWTQSRRRLDCLQGLDEAEKNRLLRGGMRDEMEHSQAAIRK